MHHALRYGLKRAAPLAAALTMLIGLTGHAQAGRDGWEDHGWYPRRHKDHDWHHGKHHDLHGGRHVGPHSGPHWDPWYGWHYGRHYGPHKGRHHDWHYGPHHDWYGY
jgi:hypothetical protein